MAGAPPGDDLSAIRERLDAAWTPFELTRCHFEVHAYIKRHPESAEAKRLLAKIDRKLKLEKESAAARKAAPAGAPAPRPLSMALRPLPWAVAAIVIVYVILHLIGRRH